MKSKQAGVTVSGYIAKCPASVQALLKKMRAAIRAAAPGATERTDYFLMPGYSYDKKEYDYDGMFAWFSYKKPCVRLHVRPPVIRNHAKELKGCTISTGIVGFPEEAELPIVLIKKMVKESVAVMKAKAKK